MAAVDIEGLRKSYGKAEIIHGVDLAIAEGEFISLIGASGCGKSTLLRMIAGLEPITGGRISLDGRVINDVAPKDRDIAMVFQNYALYPHLTVFENMGFSLKLRNVPKPEIEKAVGQAAALLGLEPYLQRYPKELSGGQRQRVAMGRAIVRKPQVFLFDEPLSNLDAKLRVQMRSEIRALQRRLGTTSIYVTHDQMEAMTMSDRIVVLNAGRIEQVGAPLEVYDRPANIFVATFIGSPAMNLLEGRVERSDGKSIVWLGEIAVSLELPDEVRDGAAVVLGIRPEHFELDPGQPSTSALPVVVQMTEPTGAELQVYGEFAGDRIVATFRNRPALGEGETVPMRMPQSALHVFDRDSGRRLN
ncbi:ABC transporter ATP-binding protein [Consotaella salsifontis]|uniref:Carbohydrate ABC transporter ATP-binding protein, CUT1 family n=1 Tax=Consotaella salsifontis TaxID=1365950 RepID=A0A1T4RNM3_9HYPH|nr:sn-glycerol-3-phosphate ABC transporter ATP-binding protein UgpC [Consotaella salsifontis]SKA17569.1 carbohydrate ABC transporter ATP-binding protein, CUT1 family [Consotaella salsifontis]